jgi:hypothetical protein
MSDDSSLYSGDSYQNELLFNDLHRIVFGVSFEAKEKVIFPGTCFMVRQKHVMFAKIFVQLQRRCAMFRYHFERDTTI